MRAKAKQRVLIELQAPPEPIPFFDDDRVPQLPPWRSVTLQEPEWSVIVDEVDYHWLQGWLWFMIPSGYAVRSRLKDDPPGGKLIYMHREILARSDPRDPDWMDIRIGDHLNGCGFDNRRVNLRWASLSENAKNKHGEMWWQWKYQERLYG